MVNWVIHEGDCLDVMVKMDENSIDAIVTDPPYGLSFMGKAWDQSVPGVEVWRECLRVLRPGGHLLSFAGARTQHRMAVAIEDAGFEIRDMIAWVYGSGFPKSRNVGKEVSEFDGWGTALKPALEPITVARKPLIGTVSKNVMEHGTGALNINGCRVEVEYGGRPKRETAAMREDVEYHGNALSGRLDGSLQSSKAVGETTQGRWPANLIHDGSDEVVDSFPAAVGQQGALTGKEPSAKMGRANCYGEMNRRHEANPRLDSGSAARFFYCAKASKEDRNEGLEEMPDQVLARSCQAAADAKRGKVVGEAGGAFNKARAVKNNHPTVKPTNLMRYLVRLVTPPGGLVLDPFTGSGSTGKGAILEGFDFVGIEINPEYRLIAEKRIQKVARQGRLF